MGCMGALSGQRTCPHCGYGIEDGYDPNYIKPGSILQARYVVGRIVHRNGEGAQYIGFDSAARTPVWIQEYFPHTIALRGPNGEIAPRQGLGAQFKALMSDFVDISNEIKRLSITEPVIPVENVLYENNTVYAVYSDLAVMPLETYLKENGGSLSLEKTKAMFLPLLGALNNIHSHGQIHRGVSPYTVYADADGRLYLWDFALSAVRTANSELEAELFSGYSAPEQYSSSAWQGSWTDVYAVAALLYRTLSGVVPPKSTLIGQGRPLTPLEDMVPDIPGNISDAVADAMRLDTDNRTQAIATLTSQLIQSGGTSTAIYDTNRMQKASGREKKRRGGSAKYVALALLLTVVVLGSLIFIFMTTYYKDIVPPGQSQGDSPEGDDPAQVDQPYDSASVPRFIGQNAANLAGDESYKERYEFSLKQEYNEIYPEGVVFDQSPPEGTRMPDKGVVILHVSKGPEIVEMPDLMEEKLEDALAKLTELSTELQPQIFERYQEGAEAGTVVRTVPEAGTEMDPKRQQVYLFVAKEMPVSESSSSSSSSSRPSSSQGDSSRDIDNFFHN